MLNFLLPGLHSFVATSSTALEGLSSTAPIQNEGSTVQRHYEFTEYEVKQILQKNLELMPSS